MWSIPYMISKMAARGNDNINWRERCARGRARTLIEALERVETRGARGGGRPQMNVLGRAGVMPQNWVETHGAVRTMCDGREVGLLEPHSGGLSLRRGQGQSFVINTPFLNNTSNNPLAGKDRGWAISPSSPTL